MNFGVFVLRFHRKRNRKRKSKFIFGRKRKWPKPSKISIFGTENENKNEIRSDSRPSPLSGGLGLYASLIGFNHWVIYSSAYWDIIGFTLAGSKCWKGDELPRNGPSGLCEIFFFCTAVSYLFTYLLPDGYRGNELPDNGSRLSQCTQGALSTRPGNVTADIRQKFDDKCTEAAYVINQSWATADSVPMNLPP